MKSTIAVAITLFMLLPAPALGAAEASAAPLRDRLAVAGSFFGGFLLVMGVIFVLLLSTRKIAAWVDKQRAKNKDKHNN